MATTPTKNHGRYRQKQRETRYTKGIRKQTTDETSSPWGCVLLKITLHFGFVLILCSPINEMFFFISSLAVNVKVGLFSKCENGSQRGWSTVYIYIYRGKKRILNCSLYLLANSVILTNQIYIYIYKR